MANEKQSKFKIKFMNSGVLYNTYTDLDKIYLVDDNEYRLSLNEFINSLTLALKTIEARLEALDGIKADGE